MRRTATIPTLAAMVLLFLGIAAVEADQAESSGPSALALETVKDFGMVDKGQRITHSFELRNNGDAVLEITNVKPSCGCTVAEYDKKIAPGAVGKVTATVDTSSFKGGIAKSIRVYTNDSNNPQITLVMKANVTARVEVDPGYSRFVAVYGEPQKTSVQSIWAADRRDLEIKKAESPYPFVKVRYRESEEEERNSKVAGKQWQVEIDLDPSAPVGPLADFVVLTTNHPDLKTVRVPISGFVRPVLSVTPRIADFGRREVAEPQTAILEIRNLSSSAVKLGDVSIDLDGLEAAVEPVEEGRLYKVLLTLNPGMPEGDFEGQVSIRTTSSKQPTIEISVKGVIL